MADNPPIISVDYTDLIRHRSRSFTFDSIAIPIGVDWQGVGWGAAAGGATTVTTLVILLLVGLPWWISLLLGVAAMLGTYALVSKDSRGRISPTERLLLAIDYLLVQPPMLHGTGRDDEATNFHWQALLWRPEWMPESTDEFAPPALYGIRTKGL